MRAAHLILLTGLPATGKTTLARHLARHYRMPVINKDVIKEPLLEVLGASDRAQSRRLSDASFAVMFAQAQRLLEAGVDLILEGNFRVGEHEAALRPVLGLEKGLGATPVHLAQVLCRVDEAERLARLSARTHDVTRHPGHRDAELVKEGAAASGDFLNLPGVRVIYEGRRGVSTAFPGPADQSLLDELQTWIGSALVR